MHGMVSESDPPEVFSFLADFLKHAHEFVWFSLYPLLELLDVTDIPWSLGCISRTRIESLSEGF